MDEVLSAQLREAFADDIETLALLQDRELDSDTIAVLQRLTFPDNLALLPRSERALHAFAGMREAMRGLAATPDQGLLNQLAADYAAIYLNGALGASPMESVWLSEDHTACHEPMFELREAYAARGLQASDWRRRPDDHLVLQLQFLAHCLRDGGTSAQELADFLDKHLLRWLDRFCGRIAARCDTPFYAGLALLTAAQIDGLRDILAEVLQQARPSPEELEAKASPPSAQTQAVVKFLPGQGPSW